MAAAPARSDTQAMLPATMRTDALLRRYARERRPADLDLLVRRFQPLARSIARRYRGASMAPDDLEQAACLGLVGALQRFDPDRGCAFGTFAVPAILGEIRRQYREALWPAHVPGLVKDRVRRVRATADAFVAERGRAPRVDEIATRLGCSEEGVVESLLAASTLNRVSLDRAYADEGDEGAPLVASLGDDDPGLEPAECRADLEPRDPPTRRCRAALRLTHDLIAQLLGAQRPTVTTSLNDLERSGRLLRRSDRTWIVRASSGGPGPAA